jgi:hypothetical protein
VKSRKGEPPRKRSVLNRADKLTKHRERGERTIDYAAEGRGILPSPAPAFGLAALAMCVDAAWGGAEGLIPIAAGSGLIAFQLAALTGLAISAPHKTHLPAVALLFLILPWTLAPYLLGAEPSARFFLAHPVLLVLACFGVACGGELGRRKAKWHAFREAAARREAEREASE